MSDLIERLRTERSVYDAELADEAADEIERLRAALAKSCEEGRDEMYDCGYNRLRAALERIVAALTNQTAVGPDGALEIAREALK
jgi:hypothetical protein